MNYFQSRTDKLETGTDKRFNDKKDFFRKREKSVSELARNRIN